MSIDVLASWAQIISVTGIVLVAIFRYERRLQRRLDKQDNDVAHLRETLDRQFGTNGFRLSESIRRLEVTLDKETQRIDQHLMMHAEGNNE
jgi:hypothetical protein